MLQRLSDSFWFQSFGCVLGFDWHSSGIATTACGALKEGLKARQKQLGSFVAVGKGATYCRTSQEIETLGPELDMDPAELIYAGGMAAKVDSAGLQDSHQIYHHSFVFNKQGVWCVVQQGMNTSIRCARRYDRLSEGAENFVCEPHAAICCDNRGEVLNMVARESEEARQTSSLLTRERPERLVGELKRLQQLEMPAHHEVRLRDIHLDRLHTILLKTYEGQAETFEALLGMSGVGGKTNRALSLISELAYGATPSLREPVRYSFALGGKGGHPYPVDRANYHRSIATLEDALQRAKLGDREKLAALRRLASSGEMTKPRVTISGV